MSFFNQFKSAYFYNSNRKIDTDIVVAAPAEKALGQKMEQQRIRAPCDLGGVLRSRPWLDFQRTSQRASI